MKRKSVSILLAVAMAVTTLTGCGSGGQDDGAAQDQTEKTTESAAAGASTDQTTAQGKPFAGQTLTVAVEDGGPYAIWYESIKHEFEELTGATVTLVGSTAESETAELMSQSGYYDVLTMDGPMIPQYASMGYLLPLDDLVDKEDLKDFYDSAIESVSWDGGLYCLPYLVHAPVLYYRKDLFEQAGIDHAPQTKEEYLEMSQKLTDPATGIYGTIIEGKQSSEAVSQLMDKIYQFGGEVISTKDPKKIAFNSQEVKDAFRYVMQFYDTGCIPKESSAYNNGDVQNMFLEGKLAMACNWPYMWEMVNDEQYSKVVDKVGVVAQPGANAVWSWSFGVCSHSKKQDLAFAWCEWATSADVIARLGAYFINPVTRQSSVEKTVAVITDPADKEAFEGMSKSLAQGIAPVLSTNFEDIRTRIALTLNRITTRTATDIDGEVEECAKEIQAILDDAE